MKTLKLTALCLLINSSLILSQSKFPGWEVFTSFNLVKKVAVNQNQVWAASTGGLFTFNATSPSTTIKKFTTQDGMITNELSAVYVDNSGNIWIGAGDGVVSLYNPVLNTFRSITDIQNSGESARGINDFCQYGDYMFFATDFSIIKFRISQFQFVDQPYIYLGQLPVKSPVYSIIVVNDTIYAGTKNGIAYANINLNLPIQSNWKSYDITTAQLPSNFITSVSRLGENTFIGTNAGMAVIIADTIREYRPMYNSGQIFDSVVSFATLNNEFYFAGQEHKGPYRVFRVNLSNILSAELVYSGNEFNDVALNSAGELLMATNTLGVNYFRNNSNNYYVPNSPASNLFQHITVDAVGNVWGCSGGSNAGLYRYNGSAWKNFNTSTHPWMGGNDFRQIYSSRFSNTVLASGYGEGLLKINGDSLFLFNDANSSLQYFISPGFVLVEGVKEDNSGNLWLINRATQEPIVNFTSGERFLVPSNSTQTTIINLDIDNYNTKWMTFPNDVQGSTRGIVYFNENTIPTGLIITAAELGADINGANDVIVDKNGEVWVATDNGIVIIRNPSEVITNPGSLPNRDKMRIIDNGLSTPLLDNFQTIAVDAINNKWLGTFSNGVIYVSADGSTILKRFNTSNSPLVDNKINTIAPDFKSGKVYFGSQKGLVSYQTVAAEPLSECSSITAGPNPFLIPNDNLLRIDGLVGESTVKILTLSGLLVHEFESPGGRIANWDGRDQNGNLVSSGIYIIVGYNKDASKVCKGKVAVVRR